MMHGQKNIKMCVNVAEIRNFLSTAYFRLGLFTEYLLTTRHWPIAKEGKCYNPLPHKYYCWRRISYSVV